MRIRYLIASGMAALALTLATGCGGDDTETASFTVEDVPSEQAAVDAAAPAAKKPKVKVPAGAPPKKLVVKDLKEGSGATAKAGDDVSMNYVGVAYSTKKEFDNSYDRGQPFDFTLGQGSVIPGWDEGIVGMKVGGRRQLVIPPNQAYGPQGQPPAIGPNETLVFIVDLLDIK